MGRLALPLTDLYAPIDHDLVVARRILDEELTSELPVVNALCTRLRTYGGKMLRPALLLLSGRATGRLTGDHHTLAAVVELVHLATLVHDDVLDEADERRGRPTVRLESGNTAAVLLGDYLISHAYHLCSVLKSRHASRRIGAATNTVCEGELVQNHLRNNGRVSEDEYLEIIRRKTGALTAASCELGAYFAGADQKVVTAMSTFGMAVGVAFQIIDDVLDVVGDREIVGKTLGQDFALGKLTLPTIHCLNHAGRATACELKAALTTQAPDTGARLRGWLDETGSVDYAVAVAEDYIRASRRCLEGLADSAARSSLVALAEFIIQRRR